MLKTSLLVAAILLRLLCLSRSEQTEDYDDLDQVELNYNTKNNSKAQEVTLATVTVSDVDDEEYSEVQPSKPEEATHRVELLETDGVESELQYNLPSARRSGDGARRADKESSQRFVELLTEMGYLPGWVSTTEGQNSLFTSSVKSFQRDYGLEVTGTLDESTLSYLSRGRCSYPGVRQHRPFSLKQVYSYQLGSFAKKLGYEATKEVWEKATGLVSSFTKGAVRFEEVKPGKCADINVCFLTGPLHIGNVFFSGENRNGTLAYVHSAWFRRDENYEVLHYVYVDSEKRWLEARAGSGGGGGGVENYFYSQRSAFRPSLLVTFIHEIGHVLGIEHVRDPKSIMFAFSLDDSRLFNHSSISKQDEQLFYNHVHAKQLLEESAYTAKPQRTETTTTATTTTTTPTTESSVPYSNSSLVENLCDGKYTLFSLLDEHVYIVKQEYVWILDPRTLELLSTQPTHIRVLWPSYMQPRVSCIYRDYGGSLKLVYKQAVFDYVKKRYGKLEKPVQYCFEGVDRILAFNGKFAVLEKRRKMSDADDLQQQQQTARSDKDPEYTDAHEMDFIMRNGSIVFYFKDNQMWMDSNFSWRKRFAKNASNSVVGFWLAKYCNQNTSQLLELTSVARKVFSLSDSLLLGKKSLLSLT